MSSNYNCACGNLTLGVDGDKAVVTMMMGDTVGSLHMTVGELGDLRYMIERSQSRPPIVEHERHR